MYINNKMNKSKYLIKQAQEAYNKDDYNTAIDFYEKAIITESELSKIYQFNIDYLKTKNYKTNNLNDSISSGILYINIIIPVFNALSDVKECLNSVNKNLDNNFKIKVIIINDFSNQETTNWLRSFCRNNIYFELVENPKNLGYTKSINIGLKLSNAADAVILLNSDTIVTKNWISGMVNCMLSDPNIGVVGPLSNAAGLQSIPYMNDWDASKGTNLLADLKSIEERSNIITKNSLKSYPHLPVINGFCFMIRKQVIENIGYFDEQNFPKGYGEEDDFCIRAAQSNFKLVVADDVYIYHKKSKSFGHNNRKLLSSYSTNVLKNLHKQKYFDFKKKVSLSVKKMDEIRKNIQESLGLDIKPNKANILFVISTTTGGTPQTNLDLMRAISNSYNCYLLQCNSKVINFYKLVNNNVVELKSYKLTVIINPLIHTSTQYDKIVSDIIDKHQISLIHIRHIAWNSINLPIIAKDKNIPVVYSFHDFYALCPSHNLLDNNLKYCSGVCNNIKGTCKVPLWRWELKFQQNLKNNLIYRWREMFKQFLNNCDRFVTTDESGKNIIENIYSFLKNKVTVIPHGRDFKNFYSKNYTNTHLNEKIRILVLGNIFYHKGGNIIKLLKQRSSKYEFHFLGLVEPKYKNLGIMHGEYDRDSVFEKIQEIDPMFGIIFSIWPETFCHTLTEMWVCGIPILAIDLGAVGNRIRKTGAGWLIPNDSSIDNILETMNNIVHNKEDFQNKLNAVKLWQENVGKINTTNKMAEKYKEIYNSLLNKG